MLGWRFQAGQVEAVFVFVKRMVLPPDIAWMIPWPVIGSLDRCHKTLGDIVSVDGTRTGSSRTLSLDICGRRIRMPATRRCLRLAAQCATTRVDLERRGLSVTEDNWQRFDHKKANR